MSTHTPRLTPSYTLNHTLTHSPSPPISHTHTLTVTPPSHTPFAPLSLFFTAALSLSSSSRLKSRARTSSGASWVGCLKTHTEFNTSPSGCKLFRIINTDNNSEHLHSHYQHLICTLDHDDTCTGSVCVCKPVFDLGVSRQVSAGVLFRECTQITFAFTPPTAGGLERRSCCCCHPGSHDNYIIKRHHIEMTSQINYKSFRGACRLRVIELLEDKVEGWTALWLLEWACQWGCRTECCSGLLFLSEPNPPLTEQ